MFQAQKLKPIPLANRTDPVRHIKHPLQSSIKWTQNHQKDHVYRTKAQRWWHFIKQKKPSSIHQTPISQLLKMTTKSYKNSCFGTKNKNVPLTNRRRPLEFVKNPFQLLKKNSRIVKKALFENKNQSLEKHTCLNQRKIQKEVVTRQTNKPVHFPIPEQHHWKLSYYQSCSHRTHKPSWICFLCCFFLPFTTRKSSQSNFNLKPCKTIKNLYIQPLLSLTNTQSFIEKSKAEKW